VPLPAPLTSFVGREREVADLAVLLCRDDVRLVTLTGPGGVGKTRLALAAAAVLASDFADGVAFVDLAPVADPNLVASTMVSSLGLRSGGDRPFVERLIDALRDRHLLLVLDNCEQVAAASPLFVTLLASCPRLTIATTSRALLHVSGEHDSPVPPLALPDPAQSAVTAEAVRLFVARARAADPAFSLTPENTAAVAAIVRRLDGLPLAIELAAARMAHLSPNALLSHLEQRLPLLTGGPRDQPARLQTMRDALAWSYDLLSPDEQALFCQLAVFVGGFSLEAARAIVTTPGNPTVGILDGIASLVGKSFLQSRAGPGGEPRYQMLETVREYGLEQIAGSDEESAVRERHAAWVLILAERCAPSILANDPSAMERLTYEHQNLRAALTWFAVRVDTEALLRLTGALTYFWWLSGHVGEGRTWHRRALAADSSPQARMQVLFGAARFASQDGRHEEATALAEELLHLAHAAGDRASEANAHYALSLAANRRGAREEALASAQRAVALYRETPDRHGLAWALQQLGIELMIAGEISQAATLFTEALEQFRKLNSLVGAAYAVTNLGVTEHALGHTRRAAARYRESLALRAIVNDSWETANHLELTAALAVEVEAVVPAARLLGAADGLYQTLGTISQRYVRERRERAEVAARAHLSAEAYDAAWQAGQGLSLAEALSEAAAVVTELADANVPSTVTGRFAGLTPREREVLRLVVAGHSNPAIGERLFISPRTAQTHVTNILAKLGVASRAEAAAVAVRDGLG
jgi:non-specific serine/threonine protein kinase